MSKPGTETRKPAGVQESQASRKPVKTDHGTIATLAYELWQQRGCPTGSAELDWFQAERVLAEQAFGSQDKSDSTAA
jgi:hypothetical protein